MPAQVESPAPVALPSARLPGYNEHHTAKHRLIAEYMKVWLAKLAQSYPQVAIIDAFASAGRYRDGRSGSPLVLLDAYLTHTSRSRFKAPPHFIFIEERRDFAQHLKWEVESGPDLQGATVSVVRAPYDAGFPWAIQQLVDLYGTAALPAFAFVDPLGYQKTPISLIGNYRARLGSKAEAMIYVPTDFMARFLSTTITEQALDKSFGSRAAWEEARREAHSRPESARLLAEAYAGVLRDKFGYVSRFVVDPASRNRYYLFFGTDHIDGLKAMKAAYWKVDPEEGRGYRQDHRATSGQLGLFNPALEAPNEPEQDLLVLMRQHFRNEAFAIEDAELFALTQTGFRETHVRSLALLPALDAGELDIVKTAAKRARTFPPGTRVCFRRNQR